VIDIDGHPRARVAEETAKRVVALQHIYSAVGLGCRN
jgi:hypothetical protein